MSIHEAILSGDPAVIRAAIDGNEGSLDEILSAGGYSGVAPIHLATKLGQRDTVTCLAARGADLEAADLDHQTTALGWAAFFANAEMARHLIDLGASLNPHHKPVDIALYGCNGDWSEFTDATPEAYQRVIDLLREHGGVADGLEAG